MPGRSRRVYIVYEPYNPDGAVPRLIQRTVGFSHVKLVVISSGSINGPGRGKIYDIGSAGGWRKTIDFDSGPWPGRQRGETSELVCNTVLTNDQIQKAMRRVKDRMGSYNLIYSNCRNFATNLAEAIDREEYEWVITDDSHRLENYNIDQGYKPPERRRKEKRS